MNESDFCFSADRHGASKPAWPCLATFLASFKLSYSRYFIQVPHDDHLHFYTRTLDPA